MKKLIIIIAIMASFAMPTLASDFQSGNLLYTIINTYPPQVRLDGHVNGTAAQGELIIPETVTFEGVIYAVVNIRDKAFLECAELESITIGDSVKSIGFRCFEGCTGLRGDLIIPNSVKSIGHSAFYLCSNFDGILVISDNITKILHHTFNRCGFTGELVIPKGVTKIGYGAFEGCSGFTGNLVIPNLVTKIDCFAFAGCTGFDGELSIGNAVTVIDGGAFQGCTGLTGDLIIPNSVTKIEMNAFQDCSSFNGRFEISLNLDTIGRGAFRGCSGLSGDLVIPEGVTAIDWYAFEDCSSFSGNLEIPGTVETIGWSSFINCSFSSLTIGESVKGIQGWAFKDVPLQSIWIKTETPPALDQATLLPAFENVSKDIPVIVPCGTLEVYRNTEGWNEFTNITEGVAYDFVALSEDEDAGFVNILKEATCEDMTVEVEAVPKGGGSFYYWEANGEVVSSENPYSFTLEGDTRLVAVFSTTGVGETEQSVSVYPNPAREKITIEGAEAAEVQVYNAFGQLVKTTQNTNEVNLEGLPQGVYLLRVRDAEGTVFAKRVIVCR